MVLVRSLSVARDRQKAGRARGTEVEREGIKERRVSGVRRREGEVVRDRRFGQLQSVRANGPGRTSVRSFVRSLCLREHPVFAAATFPDASSSPESCLLIAGVAANDRRPTCSDLAGERYDSATEEKIGAFLLVENSSGRSFFRAPARHLVLDDILAFPATRPRLEVSVPYEWKRLPLCETRDRRLCDRRNDGEGDYRARDIGV